MSSHALESRASTHATIAWEDRCCTFECCAFLLLLLRFYWWAQCQMVWNIFLITWGWLCSLTASCPPPGCWLLWQARRDRLAIWELFMGTGKTVQCYQHCCVTIVKVTNTKQNIIWTALNKINAITLFQPGWVLEFETVTLSKSVHTQSSTSSCNVLGMASNGDEV